MNTSDPENASGGDTEVEITDLDSPPGTGKVPGSTRRSLMRSPRGRVWMSIAVVVGVALLVDIVLGSLPHAPEPTKVVQVTVPPLQTDHPLSLSVVDGIAYASSPDGTVTALRISDGFLLWHHRGRNAGEESTTVADGVVLLAPVAFENNPITVTVYALRASDGSPLWSRTLPTNSPNPLQLTVANGVVYVRSEVESIEALRASDGSVLWHYTVSAPFVTTPSVADGVVYAGTQDGHLYALRSPDGFPLWKYSSLIPPSTVSPVLADGMVYLTLQNGSMDVLRAGNGVLLWHYFPPSPLTESPPLVANGLVYVSLLDGSVNALRASDGFTLWRAALHVPYLLPSMVVGGGVIYVGDQDGGVDALRTSNGSMLWRYQGEEGGATSITVVQGVIYLALQIDGINSIAALRASDSFVLWRYIPHADATQLSPLLADGLVLLALQDGSIDALRASSGSLLWQRAIE